MKFGNFEDLWLFLKLETDVPETGIKKNVTKNAM